MQQLQLELSTMSSERCGGGEAQQPGTPLYKGLLSPVKAHHMPSQQELEQELQQERQRAQQLHGEAEALKLDCERSKAAELTMQQRVERQQTEIAEMRSAISQLQCDLEQAQKPALVCTMVHVLVPLPVAQGVQVRVSDARGALTPNAGTMGPWGTPHAVSVQPRERAVRRAPPPPPPHQSVLMRVPAKGMQRPSVSSTALSKISPPPTAIIPHRPLSVVAPGRGGGPETADIEGVFNPHPPPPP